MGGLTYILGILCVFVSLYYFVMFLASALGEKRWKVASRLQWIREIEGGTVETEPLNLPFRERVIVPLFQKLGEWLQSLTPSRIRKGISDRLIAAGYTNKSAAINFMTLQGILIFLLPLLLIFFSMLFTSKMDKALLLGLLGFIAALLLPGMVLNNKKIARQAKIRKSLPDVLDLLIVSVEAGLGFDMALLKVTEKLEGVLADELKNVLNEIKLGKVRRIALKEMAERTGVEELISFVGAVVQADQLGVSIGNVLRVQGDAMRTRRRQNVEEAAAKAPVKMLVPLIFFIFPAMFTVILGPAIINFMETFGGR